MTSRERVLAALNHKQPDKAPISIGGHICDSFTKFAKDNYEKHLGLKVTPHIITDYSMGAVETPETFLKKFEVDFRTVRMNGPENFTPQVFGDGSYIDEYGCLNTPCEYYYDVTKRPLQGRDITVKDIENAQWPDPYDPGRIEGLKEKAKKLYETTGCAIVADMCCSGPFEMALLMRGWEDFLCDLYSDPHIAEALMEKIIEIDIGFWDAFLNEVGEYVDVIAQGDDLAMQDRSLMPIDMYNKHINKFHKRLYSFIKSRTNAKILHHCCGSAYELIPGLIEAGVDILNPVQTTAKNMEPERLKNEYGNDLSFWGGLDIQKVLPFGTPQEIEDEVKKLIEIFGKDGGYVFAPAHNIQALVPPENIDTMLKAALKYR